MVALIRYSWLLVIACKEFVPSPEVATVKKDSSPIVTEDKQHGEFTAYLEKLSGRKRLQAKVDPNRLTIDFITAGLQSSKYGKFVRLYFRADLQRDYLEIARCEESAMEKKECLFGKEVVSNSISREDVEQTRKLLAGEGLTTNDTGKYDCWKTAIISNCTEIGRVYGAESHIDLTANKSGTFTYFARPCIIKDRINELYASSSQLCSNYFARSLPVTTPSYDEGAKIWQKEIDKITRELNQKTHKVYLLTVQLSKVMEKHEEEMIENARKRQMKEGIAMIAGMAIGVAGSMFSMSYAEPSMLWQNVGKGGAEGVTRVLENGNLQQLIEQKPAASDAVGAGLEAGKALGAAFADILASPDDYPKTCTECLIIRGEIAATVGDMDPTNPDIHHGGHLYRELLQQLQDKYRELQKSNAEDWEKEQWKQEIEKKQDESDEQQ